MSTESKGVKEFLDQVHRDSGLQDEIRKAYGQLVEIGKNHGFAFTHQEMHDELRRRWGITKSQDDPQTCTVTVP